MLGSYLLEAEGRTVHWVLRIDAVDVGDFLHLDGNDDGAYDASELNRAFPTLNRYLSERLTLSTDGVSCGPPQITSMRPDDRFPHWLDFRGVFRCPQPLGVVEMGNRVLLDYVRDYQHFVDFETAQGAVQRVLNDDRPSIRVRVGEPVGAGTGAGTGGGTEGVNTASSVEIPTGALGRIGLFIRQGIHHIFIGFDHILFILGLTLAARSLRRLTLVVTAFTVAHSLTLALASLELVHIDPRLAESLIALSVAYVGLENVVREPRRRAWLAFGFGLVHGVGFSSALSDLVAVTTMDTAGRAQLLFGFNAGVELGQLVIVSIAYPVVAALRRRAIQRPVVRVASLAILVCGAYWFVERAIL